MTRSVNKLIGQTIYLILCSTAPFTISKDQSRCVDLLKRRVASGGYVILAEYNLNSASKCAGLDVHRYSKEMLVDR